MANTVNVGLRIPSVHPTDVEAVRSFILEAENLGYHSIWVGDHVYYRVDVIDPLVLLTWAAAQTSRVRLGTAVMLTAYRNPVLLAKTASSIDYLSGGRLTLGISIGGTEAEYKSLGVAMNERVAHLRENVAVMRSLWAGEDVSYDGRYRQIEHGTMSPKPKQLSADKTGVPLWFGGGSEPMLRRLAEIADGWVGSGGAPAENFVSGVESIKGFAKEKGRNPDTLGYSKLINVSVADTKQKAFDLAKEHWSEYYGPNFDVDKSAIYGEPHAVRAGLREFGEADTPEVTLILEPSSLDIGQLELLAKTTENLMA